jgi:hypothetical protein
MENYIQTNLPGYYKDINTGVVLNKNISEYNQYMIDREKMIQQDQLSKKVEELSDAVTEIKQILQLMVKNKNGDTHTS